MKHFTEANTILPTYSRSGDMDTLGGFLRRYADDNCTTETIRSELLRVLNLTGGRCVFTGRAQWVMTADGRYDFSALQVDHIHATRRFGVLTAGNIMPLEASLNATKGAQHFSSIWKEDGPHHPAIATLEDLYEFMATVMKPYAKAYPATYALNEEYSLQNETTTSFNETIDKLGLRAYFPLWAIKHLYTEHKPAAARSMIEELRTLYELEPKQWDDRPTATQKNDFNAVKQLSDYTDEATAKAFIAGDLSHEETIQMTIQIVRKLGEGYAAQQVARIGNTVLRRHFDGSRIRFTWAGVVTAKVIEATSRRTFSSSTSPVKRSWQTTRRTVASNSAVA